MRHFSLIHNFRLYLIEVGKMLLDAGADVNAEDNWNGTPLHLAALSGRERMVQLLLDRGSYVNAHTDNGWTPLHGAVVGRHLGVAQLLLGKGANISDAEAEFGGDDTYAAKIHRGLFTPLGLVLANLQLTLDNEEVLPDNEGLIDMKEWRERNIKEFQAMADFLRQRGGK